MTAAVARTRGLVKRYGKLAAIDGVDVEFAENRIYGLLGRNGVGK
ncbi:MAG TPA: multidrug ABC transporter ATP-binding protein, partial [Microbacterium ginsengisoli]|nr:multidrug ABC transporter ATP-binding protein [Microbacterium ginsengisoli]